MVSGGGYGKIEAGLVLVAHIHRKEIYGSNCLNSELGMINECLKNVGFFIFLVLAIAYTTSLRLKENILSHCYQF